MLQFFRKYQKFFFIIVTIFVVISFSFFGTFGATPNTGPKKKDRVVGKTVNGSPLKEFEIEQMSQFLGSSWRDFSSNHFPNLMNDGVIKKDFLETGIAMILVDQYFQALKDDLESRIEKAQKYQTYVHPGASFLNAKSVWEHFCPKLNQELEKLQSFENLSLESFASIANLFLYQREFPQQLLKRVLNYHQGQYSWLAPDPRLVHEDLSLFGFHTLTDWFGENFLDLISQFVINVAVIAEEKGYVVTEKEALSSLVSNTERGFQKYVNKLDLPSSQAEEIFRDQFRALGLDQKEAVKIWRKILLFRRYFQSVGNNVLVDSLPYQQFISYALEKASIDLYSLPRSFRFENFHDFLKYQMYLKAVSPEDSLAAPNTFFSAKQVSENFPGLIERTFKLGVTEVKKEEVGLRVSIKEMLEWQLKEEAWEFLRQTFPYLSSKALTRQERFDALERLEPSKRHKINSFTRNQIADAHSEWLEEEMNRDSKKEVILSIRPKNTNFPISIKDPERFLELIEKAPLKDEENISDVQAIIREELFAYSDDGETYYRFEIIERQEQNHILSFSDATMDGSLDFILRDYLEAQYPLVKNKDPAIFQNENGVWKKYFEVKEEDIGRFVFANSLKTIEEDAVLQGEDLNWESIKGPLEFYVSHGLYSFMRNALENKALQSVSENPLRDQWQLEKKQKEFVRNEKQDWNRAFEMEVGDWSSVLLSENGNISFFHLESKTIDEELALEKMKEGRKILSYEAQRALTEKILKKIQIEKAIVLPIKE